MTKKWLLLLVLVLAPTTFVGCPGRKPKVAPEVTGQSVLDVDRPSGKQRRNIILFVADGFRPGLINETDTPTFAALANSGVRFVNSHSMYPTLTTANAASIATGHYLGDHSDYANSLYIGYRLFDGGFFPSRKPGSFVPFLENDEVIADVNMHQKDEHFLNEETILSLARRHGYRTAAIGKSGPVMLQDVGQARAVDGIMAVPETTVFDDKTGREGGIPLPPGIMRSLEQMGLGTKAPGRDNNAPGTQQDNGNIGNWEKAGTLVANESQQKYFLDAVTKVLLPQYAEQSQPFIIVFWSRDPDGTQHSHGDSLGTITPGINGPTSMAAVRNADSNLRTLRDAINADPRLAANTDIIVTSDHGFSTISRRDLDGSGKSFTASYAAQQHYKDPVTGKELQPKGFLPHGFLAIDLAHGLNLTHYDPDTPLTHSFAKVDANCAQVDCVAIAKSGHGLIGGSGVLGPITDAEIIVASNGGSDLIYVPGKDINLMTRIVKLLAKQDYVSGLFVDDSFGKIPGTLPMSAINLRGTGLLPMPSLVVNFRTFATDPAKPFVTQVVLADTSLTQGQGMHGSFGRGDTLNAMLAFGPDFKNGFIDPAPSSNADLAITIAHILGLELPSKGVLRGRVLSESLRGQPMVEFTTGSMRSEVDESSGQVTILKFQDAGGVRYFDTAGFMGRTNGLDN